MNKIKLLIVPMSLLCVFASAQVKTNFSKPEKENTTQKNDQVNAIGISVPFIWSYSEATFYGLGRPYYPSGKAKSSGFNINYSRLFYKGFYAKIGAGYFYQHFNIIRPVNYISPTDQLLRSVESYNYNSLQLLAGLGYQKKMSLKNSFKAGLVYNYFSSFKQKYVINRSPEERIQINHKSIPIGSMIIVNIGVEKKIFKHLYCGADFILPVFTRWRRDEMFIYVGYSSDEEQIARSKSSAGVAFSCSYHF